MCGKESEEFAPDRPAGLCRRRVASRVVSFLRRGALLGPPAYGADAQNSA